jgi:hypothetical protein
MAKAEEQEEKKQIRAYTHSAFNKLAIVRLKVVKSRVREGGCYKGGRHGGQGESMRLLVHFVHQSGLNLFP